MRRAAVLLVLALCAPRPAAAWEHNIATWPDAFFPLPIHLRPEAPRHTEIDTLSEVVEDSLATWTDVSCSSAAFEFAGIADLPIAVDRDQVLAWESDADDWVFGSASAGATSIDVFDPDGPRVDIVFNDVFFDWVVGANTFMVEEPEWGVDPNVEVDPASVITHELGHLIGLAHPFPSVEGSQPDALATMVFALLPNAQQASLAADDKLGLCEKYPVPGGDECGSDDDCGAGEVCRTFTGEAVGEVRLCNEVRGTYGDGCSRDHFWCNGLCLFMAVDYSSGYCSDYCETDDDCPSAWECVTVSTGTDDVRVCQPGDEVGDDTGVTPVDTGIAPVDPEPDAGAEEGDGSAVDADHEADTGQSGDADSDGSTAESETDEGRSRSGCTTAGADPAFALWAAWLPAAAFATRRRRTRRRDPANAEVDR